MRHLTTLNEKNTVSFIESKLWKKEKNILMN